MLPHMCRLCAMLSTPSLYHRYCLTWGSSLKDTRKQEKSATPVFCRREMFLGRAQARRISGASQANEVKGRGCF